ncbi:ABC transporter substrate-binding protein [Pseudofrankia sp. BMG5.37]|uniref:ABC transporter substrate-binding protein n=1 Tax=Pseudofrankia sp. BMG5.37 TaxID=3050035 RepID=UPI00289411E2|nr:ABC transporter substrate-binding protein [Pseudofrankia sp. BMG5.37]MDT3441837.1 ABC transporter substrate-binding protein [Pseudofrankia sp. BMG5.37]
MGDLVLTAERSVAEPLASAFERFGHASGGGWLFGLSCDVVAPGAVVRFSMPGPASQAPIQSTGRIVEVDSGRRLVLHQESPWRSRVVLTFDPDGAGTRVRLRAVLADDCVPWLMRASGLEVPEPAEFGRAVRVGVLLPLSGAAGVFGRAAHNAGELAVDELNADGGIRGVPLRLYVGDDGTNRATARREFIRLVDLVGCDVVIAMTTSESMAAVRPLAEARGTLLLHAPASEGGPAGDRIFYLGERPADQLEHSVPLLMAETGGRGWFIVGNDYSWPRSVARAARRVIDDAGGVLLGERYLPFGCQDFTAVLTAIQATGADHLISALVGTDAVAFERASFAAGLRARVRTIAMLVDDVCREHIGDDAATGIWSVLDHFTALDDVDNQRLQRRWRQRFGLFSPPLSSTAKSVYDVVRLYAGAARAARSVDPTDVARTLRISRGRGRAGAMLPRVLGEPRRTCIAEAVQGGFVVREAPA